MKRVIVFVLTLVLILSLTACGSSTQPEGGNESDAGKTETYNYTWSACNSSSGYYALNVAVSDVINQYVDNVNVTVMESGGGADNLKNIATGQAQFGQTSVPDIYLSQNALGQFEDLQPNENVRLMLSLIPNMYYFIVSENSGINSIEDLEGAVFSPGNLSSSTERLCYTVLSALDITPDWFYASTSEAVTAMKDRRIVGFCKSGSSVTMDSSVTDVATSVDVKVLSFTKEQANKIMGMYPYYTFDTVDGGVYNQEEDIYTLASYYSYGVSKDVPEDVVYEIVKALVENLDYLSQSYAGISDFDPVEITAKYTSGYMHPGLIKYLEEQGYTVKEDQIPPEMK